MSVLSARRFAGKRARSDARRRTGPGPQPGRYLLRGVAAVTAVFACIGAAWLTSTTRNTAEHAALQAHAETAGVLANLLLPAALDDPLPGPAATANLDTLLRMAFASGAPSALGSSHVRFISPAGTVLYVYPPSAGPNTRGATEPVITTPRLGPGEARAQFLNVLEGEQRRRDFVLNVAYGNGPDPNILQVSGPAMLITDSVDGDIRRSQIAEIAAVAMLWASLVAVVTVLSRRLRRQARQSTYLAFHDALTGLANRALFNDRLLAAVASASETGGQVGLLLIDLNRFKELNDTLGHHSGDVVLRDVARVIARELRSSDLVARLGGDEFAVLVARPRHIGDVERVAERIANAVAATTHLGELAVTVDAAIGVTAFPDHGTDAATLMRKADLAMYAAKAARLPWQRYEESITTTALSSLTLPTELRAALAADPKQLTAYYQPIIDRSNRLVAVEAVARWSHPSRGVLRAQEFVPLAERIGVGSQLSKRMIDIVLAQAKTWQDAGLRLPIALNVGSAEMQNAELAQDIGDGLNRTGLSPDALIIELSQRGLPNHHDELARPVATRDIVASLRRQGITVALDQFGSSASGLAALRDVPADIVKLDGALLSELGAAGVTTEIVRSVADLAHNLGMLVVATGADRLDQLDVLTRCGCDWAQGGAIGDALPAEDLLAWAYRRGAEPTLQPTAQPTLDELTLEAPLGSATSSVPTVAS